MYHEEYEENVDHFLNELQETEKSDKTTQKDSDLLWNQVVNRIEEANLFTLLIKQPVFTSNSASPHILEAVNKKIKKFASNELQNLLGLAKPAEKAVQVKLPFDSEEVQVLRMLAGKILKRDPRDTIKTNKNPEITQIIIDEPEEEFEEIEEPVKPAFATITTPTAQIKTEQKPAIPVSKTQKAKTVKKSKSERPVENVKRETLLPRGREDREDKLRAMAPIRPANHPKMATAQETVMSGAVNVSIQNSTNTGLEGSNSPLTGAQSSLVTNLFGLNNSQLASIE